MHDAEKKARAEEACEVINRKLGWRAADPTFTWERRGGRERMAYTGGVTLSQRGAMELTKLLLTC